MSNDTGTIEGPAIKDMDWATATGGNREVKL